MKRSDTEVREQGIWLSHMLPFLSLSFAMCFCGGLSSRFCRVCHISSAGTLLWGECGTATAQGLPLSTFTGLLSIHLAWTSVYIFDTIMNLRGRWSVIFLSGWITGNLWNTVRFKDSCFIWAGWLCFPQLLQRDKLQTVGWESPGNLESQSCWLAVTIYQQEGAYLITFPLRSNPAHTHTRVFKYV